MTKDEIRMRNKTPQSRRGRKARKELFWLILALALRALRLCGLLFWMICIRLTSFRSQRRQVAIEVRQCLRLETAQEAARHERNVARLARKNVLFSEADGAF